MAWQSKPAIIQQAHRRQIKKATWCLKTWGCTIFCGKKPCRKSLTAGSPSCRSNANCKLQTRPQDRGHVTFRFAFFHEKPDAKGLFKCFHRIVKRGAWYVRIPMTVTNWEMFFSIMYLDINQCRLYISSALYWNNILVPSPLRCLKLHTGVL